ncbi:protein fem-1 homolog C [Neocloeon triangulifer]|uniref:protein fem-1 homolog C n=1 Tax=Neocloeon triangulifer TaxID=2078957 RepID=UPI00286EB9EB|nr:protein fem-1 homolog C [Neocloeon triangulifer]
MDFKSVVYTAARDGKLRRLKVFLEHRARSEVLMLVSSKTNNATPLVMACRYGHFDVAEYLIEKCNADIEQPGAVVFDGETIEGAPPLWCAAAAGHLAVVKLLVRHGANVNSITKTNSTPLRAACFDGHFDIVKFLIEHNADIEIANRHGHTCLMIVCYKGHIKIAKFLIGLKADVNRKSVKGNTALHDCAESGSLEIMKLLLHHGAVIEVDSYGMTPLLAASVTGHSHIVEYFKQHPGLVSRRDMVNAMELLGATYVDKKRDMMGALSLWRQAMEDRFADGKEPILKPESAKTVDAYNNAKEVLNLDELEELVSDPDEIRMQALLIRERILGPVHPDTSYYVRYRGAVYADAGQFDRCIALWNYALDMQQKILEPMNPMTQSSLFSFTELFSFMISERSRFRNSNSGGRGGRQIPPVAYDDILNVFKKALQELELGMANPSSENAAVGHLHRTMVLTMNICCLLARHMNFLKTAQSERLFQLTKELVKMWPIGNKGFTLLHIACSRDSSVAKRYSVCQFPAPELVTLLLKAGHAPNARDVDGNTALHVAALAKPCTPALAKALVEGDVHLDLVNKNGKTFAQLLQDQKVLDLVNPVRHTSLMCLAARTINRHMVPYKGHIPVRLESFVAMH